MRSTFHAIQIPGYRVLVRGFGEEIRFPFLRLRPSATSTIAWVVYGPEGFTVLNGKFGEIACHASFVEPSTGINEFLESNWL